MRRRTLSWWWVASALAGCWSEEPRVDGFTADQWTSLQKQFELAPPPTVCPGQYAPGPCDRGFELGRRLFFEPALSAKGQVSCATCHDSRGWYVDPRKTPLSLGDTNTTKHNSLSVVNVIYKSFFSWTGDCPSGACVSPETVILDIALPKAMGTNASRVADVVRNNTEYASLYVEAFGDLGGQDQIQLDVATSMHAYMRRLTSIDAPFDHYMQGNASALDDSARRGFTLFVGKAMCAECHGGPLLTDSKLHVTGVAQGAPTAMLDPGAGGTGAFFTPSLRHVAATGPYMHDGSLATLADVIDFYRRGGDNSGFVGVKDPLMQPLEITDDEANDLEAFLRSLTGQPISSELVVDLHSGSGTGSGPVCTAPGMMMCGTACVDIGSDPLNCSGCGIKCPTNKPVCSGGQCGH